MSILICFALKEEAVPFRPIAARHPGVFTVVVGVGRVNADRSVRKALAGMPAKPALVLTGGFAGGLHPDLKLGDVIYELSTLAAEDDKLTETLITCGAKPATFFCAERIATTVAEKQQLRAATGADAVEMESAAIQSVCAEQGIPCATVRVISDTAHEDLPLDFNALGKPDQSLDFGKLLLAVVKSPGKIPQLLALQKKTSFAARQLAGVLEKIVSA